MATNLESAFHLSQLAHPLLKASGSGSIVLMSSAAGVVHINVGSIYGATKGNTLKQLNDPSHCETNINVRIYIYISTRYRSYESASKKLSMRVGK